jgi:enoyl-CoA hydratase
MWPVLASPIKLKEYLLTGDRISAPAAEAMGMATRVVPNDQLHAEGLRVAHRLAALPAQATQDTKRAVNMHIASAVAGVLDYAIAAETRSITSIEHHQLVARVLARHAARSRSGAVGS